MKRLKTIGFHKPALLHSESERDFQTLAKAIEDELKPVGPIEEMYVADLISICWEILRWRRSKSDMINVGLRPALEHLLVQLMGESTRFYNEVADDPQDLSILYHVNEEARNEVIKVLERFGLDEGAISAQALRDALSHLEAVERILASAEVRRDRILACLTAYREAGAPRVLRQAERLVERQDLISSDSQSEPDSQAA
jgi:hypothetical protein